MPERFIKWPTELAERDDCEGLKPVPVGPYGTGSEAPVVSILRSMPTALQLSFSSSGRPVTLLSTGMISSSVTGPSA